MSKVDMKVGDIVQVKGKKFEQVVIACGLTESKAYDGSYWVYEFTTVDLPKANAMTKALDAKLTQSDPKENKFYLSGYSMSGAGKEIAASDVKIVGECKLKKEVQVTYEFAKVRMI